MQDGRKSLSPRARWAWVTSLVLAGSLVACSSGNPSVGDSTGSSVSASTASTETAPTSTEPYVPAVDDALVALGERLDDEGRLSVDEARAIFSAIVGPLPDTPPAALVGEQPHDLAGVAARRLQGALTELPDNVAAAVLAALEPQPGEEEVEVSPVRRRDIPSVSGPVTEPTPAELAEMVATIVAGLEGRSGHDLRLPLRTRIVPDRSTGGSAIASAVMVGDRVTACRIAVPQSLFADDGASVTSTIAHEVWHCFQLDTDEEAFWYDPQWIIEGQAEWAGEAFVGGSSSSASRWDTWLLRFDLSLFRRSYDAIGLYATAAQSGSDPWTSMLDMLGRENFGAVQTLFGTSVEDALHLVATADVRDPSLGAKWDITGPGVTSADGSVQFVLSEGEPANASVRAARFSVLPLNLVVPAADIVRIDVRGGFAVVEMPGAETVELADGTSAGWCVRPDGCVCPDGSLPGGVELPVATSGTGAVAAGALAVGELVVVGSLRSLEDECRNDLVGTWGADTSQVLAALTSPFGSAGLTCTGPYTLTFTSDGQYAAGFHAVCGAGPVQGVGDSLYTGTYTADGTTLAVTNLSGSGTITIAGMTRPLAGGTIGSSGPVRYEVVGDVLTLFMSVAGSPVAVSFTRRS